MRRPPRLITFDIDGTLLRSIGPQGNAAHHAAMNNAARRFFGIDVLVADVPHAGSTDMAIMRRMAEAGGIPPADIEKKLKPALDDAGKLINEYIEKNADYSHLVLPGVRDILTDLRARNVTLALATGNLRTIALAKLSAAGLASFFVTGGFGDDAELRQDIVRTSIHRSNEMVKGGKIDIEMNREDVVHIGDAVADVAIQSQLGIDAVGVLTGIFTREQLEREKPLVVFDDLSDTKAFIDALGF